jgi:hypothetical protein
MEDVLRKLMIEFCERFKLRYFVRYSQSLTQEEINAGNLLGSGELKEILNKFGNNYSRIDKEVRKAIKRMGGTGNIENSAIERLKRTITSNENDDITNYLKHNRNLFTLLTSSYKKIIDENLVDTIPIPVSKGLFSFLLKGQKLSMMVHESIHYILEKNDIDFGGEGLNPLTEGFCVFLHLRFNKYVGLYKYDNSTLTVQYRLWASFFEKLLKNVPDTEIIQTVKNYSIADLQRMIKENDKEKL